jgi:hypothetical protein
MGLRYSRELQANDNVLPLADDRMQNKKSKRAAVSSDGKQLAPVKKKRRVVKEEEYPVKTEEDIEDDLRQDKDEDVMKPRAVVKEEEDETDVKEDGEGILQVDRDESEERKKPLAALTKEEEDETETEVKEDSEDDFQRDKDEREDGEKYPAAVTKEEKDEVGHDNCRSAERSRRTANIVKRKYSLRSLSQKNNKESARSKPLRKEKGSLTIMGEVYRSPLVSSDEDEFGKCIESAVDEASDTSDSVDGIIDHDESILDCYDAQWNRMYNRLRAFKESHGHCEFFWAVDRSTFILNTPH